MDQQAPAQASDSAGTQPANPGLQARIDELVAKQRQDAERAAAAEKQSVELAAQMAQMAIQMRQPVAPVAAPVDPLAQFQDQIDPNTLKAIQAATEATRRQVEQQYQSQLAAQAAQMAGYTVRAEAAAIPNLPKEVVDRAAQLATQWRQAGIQYPPSDALNFALGEYQRGQLLKAAPVAGYNPGAAPPAITPGFAPAPPAPRGPALPANFDSLSRQDQYAALDKAGILDQPF